MNQRAFNEICRIFKQAKVQFDVLNHPPCRTSAESAETRARAGFADAIGAKALLIKMTFIGNHDEFCVLVLPGSAKMNSKKLKQFFPNLKKFRFATSEELFELCQVTPGAMPPFGKKIFPALAKLFIDRNIVQAETVGFNAAFLERSIIVKSEHYLKVAAYDSILDFAEETTNSLSDNLIE